MDYVIMAIGAKMDKELAQGNSLELNDRGFVKIDENYKTNQTKVFAGGDVVGERATVAWASRSGREAAIAIDKWLSSKV